MENEIYQILKKHKLPLEKREKVLADLLLLFSVSGRSEQFNCGKERVFGEDRCDKQCNDCLKEYGSN